MAASVEFYKGELYYTFHDPLDMEAMEQEAEAKKNRVSWDQMIKPDLSENTLIYTIPTIDMLEAMDAHNFFKLRDGGTFEIGYEYNWEYYATDECIYDIKLQSDYDNVIFIEEINARTEEPDDATKEQWPNPYDYNEECEVQGFGTDMMEELMALADDHEVQLSLVPSAFKQTKGSERPDTAALTSWDKRLGFEDSPQRNGTLVYNFQP